MSNINTTTSVLHQVYILTKMTLFYILRKMLVNNET
ncbi:hypothetical protein SVI_3388 [Shewanella violacea DSS12]|uniref:Uncharacterized protein n=1 Tax=Shewanella violacea (strain JCM 10179 / CIP 106290 / LMG 19151 / DSS12) TaxID=637905 RepID=D4ZBG4_SHEVD|nr:hypothetical protein SVI_3388 [Shewanella violacea DSS12]